MGHLRRWAALLALLVPFTFGLSPANAKEWVGLGDSFAAGPFIPSQVAPYGCLKSDRNFARQAAARLAYTIKDASCSGAKTTHMTTSQSVEFGSNAPQFDRLSTATNVVTLQIGGNDIGFSEILEECVTENPFDDKCRDKYLVNGRDIISERIIATAPKVDAVLDGIRARAPFARVFVVNYAAIVPDSGYGCWPQVPLAYLDVPYLRSKHKQLNSMLGQQAAANGATLVDDYTASIGKDACRGSSTRWVEPLFPENSAAPFHPNLTGMTGIAGVVVTRVGT
jgi:hypothetical protein